MSSDTAKERKIYIWKINYYYKRKKLLNHLINCTKKLGSARLNK